MYVRFEAEIEKLNQRVADRGIREAL